METAAVPAAETRPVPLAALALVVAMPATFVGRGSLGVRRARILAISTSEALPSVPNSTGTCSD